MASTQHHPSKAVSWHDGRPRYAMPKLPPLDEPTLGYLQMYRGALLDKRYQQDTMKVAEESAGPELAGDARTLAQVSHAQKRWQLDQCQVKYLHQSALTMCETLLAPDALAPTFPAHALWLHPLAPLLYRGEQVRGIFLFRPYDLDMLDRNPYLAHLRPAVRAWSHEFFSSETDRVEMDVFVESAGPQGARDYHTFKAAEYSAASSWRRLSALSDCLSGTCLSEQLGDGQMRILCAPCAQELDYWTRWIKTMLWVIAGKFRQPRDQGEPQLHTEEIAGGSASQPARPTKKRYTGEIIRYDASYFRSAQPGAGQPLSATHRLVTPEELGSLEEVDLARVLIWDWTDVDAFTRTLQAARYYPGGQVPTDPAQLRRVSVRGKAGKKQLISLSTWQAREAQRAQRRKQTRVVASAFQDGGTR